MTEAERQAKSLEAWIAANPDSGTVYGSQWGRVTEGPMAGVFAHLCDHLSRKPGHVVEIGPGGGRWSRHIAERLTDGALLTLVDGTDAAWPALNRVVLREFRLMVSTDGNVSEIPNSSVDLVFSVETFVHFASPLFDTYLAEIARILRPGGRLMLHYAEAWPTFPNVQPDPTQCFIQPSPGVRLMLETLFRDDREGMRMPIPRGYGSVFKSVVRA